MHLDIIPIGNSQGIRIPKSLIEQCRFGKTVEAEVVDHNLIIKSILNLPRAGWTEAFKNMTKNEDEDLLDLSNLSQEWDKEEWEW
ncbi:MAG: hypothetical protein B7Y25_04650 [Alphaproteobacteria bacterium 16-39-46]|nr:MAG: hypothetical protein B7Y25_04650 [Alphaproteobacteria bacterium 16-39-46]OZA42945.1 MAG: hypothetical protein B7X84_04475 [Alphaproteobacteria bacterium 17-39-52]HQS84202.1 AbrB/MazE/SpoVT family DNA-binding domain-containing protein [Alphaproteobacteria bacterium]HQS94050.1 AbrB/MazE/SpoVT family DNA-binding domain-containing protein [Alphaproteobacteria bacterium]